MSKPQRIKATLRVAPEYEVCDIRISEYYTVGKVYELQDDVVGITNYCDFCHDEECCDARWCAEHKGNTFCSYVISDDGGGLRVPKAVFNTTPIHTLKNVLKAARGLT